MVSVRYQTNHYEQVSESLDRLRFRLQLAEATMRRENSHMADLLSDLSDEAQDAIEKLHMFTKQRDLP